MGDGEVLVVKNLKVEVAGRMVLDDVSMSLTAGEIVALTGANGSGKSSFAMSLLGSEAYRVVDGAILLGGADMLQLSVSERAQAGLYVAWQNPVTIPGVSVFALAKAAYQARGKEIESLVNFKNKLEKILTRVGLDKNMVSRNINEGFSGGEKKRLELFWLLLLAPKLAVLDEIDSGLDVEGRLMVAEIVRELANDGVAVIIVSHYPELIAEIKPNRILKLRNGKLLSEPKRRK